MNRVLPSCAEVSKLTSQAMDESLSWRKRLGLRLHLRMCIWCRRNADQLQLMRTLSRGVSSSRDHETQLSSEARKRLADALDQNDDPS